MTHAPEVKSSPTRSFLFANERALQNTLVNGDLGTDGSHRVCFVRSEVPVGSCIPDIVCVRLSEQPRTDLIPSRFSYRHAFVLSLLRERSPLHVETIAAQSFEPPDKARLLIEDLALAGAVVPLHTGAFAISPELLAAEPDVVAIEAKLHRWKDALRQAKTYKRFADRVVVAMDAHGIPSQPAALDEFQSAGVGLCAVAPEATEWLLHPTPVPGCRGPEWEYLVVCLFSNAHFRQ